MCFIGYRVAEERGVHDLRGGIGDGDIARSGLHLRDEGKEEEKVKR